MELSTNMNLTTKIILSVIAIAFAIGLYFLIKYILSKKTTFKGYSFYGPDLLKYKPLFKLNTHDLEECKNHCHTMSKCKGITLNPIDEICYGSEEGQLRQEQDGSITAWIKPKDSAFVAKNELVLSYTDNSKLISKELIDEPYNRGQFNYSFYIYLNEFSTGNWKHVFHKGTDISSIKTNDWDVLTKRIGEQCIGVWLAPYNTTMRVALTNEIGVIEYVDVENIPTKKLTFVSVNVSENIVEIYIDSKIVKILTMTQLPRFNYGNLYAKYDSSYNGVLCYLNYTQEFMSVKAIKELNSLSLNEIKVMITNNYDEDIV